MPSKKTKYLIIAKQLLENNDVDKTVRFIVNKYECTSQTVLEAKQFLNENSNITVREIKRKIEDILYK